MDLILSAITAALMTYQTAAPEFRHNSLYTFNVDPTNGSIIVMNTQTGHLYKCTKELVCDNPEFKKDEISPPRVD